jgi:hypothetical protein
MGDLEFTLKEVVIELRDTVKELNRTVRNKPDCDKRHEKLDTRIDRLYIWFWSFVGIFITAFAFLSAN